MSSSAIGTSRGAPSSLVRAFTKRRVTGRCVRQLRVGAAMLLAVAGAIATATAGQLTLQWTDNSDNETGFAIERAPDGTTFSPIATVGADVTSYVDGPLSAATTYWYRVRAFNNAGSSAYTNVASGTTAAVLAANTAPTIGALASQSINVNGTTGALAFTVGDAETAAGSLSVSAASSNTTLLPMSGITLGGSGASRTVTLTPAANQTGTATVTITVSDGALSANSSLTLTVSGVVAAPGNTAPAISPMAAQTIASGATDGPLGFTVADAETAASSLAVSVSSSDSALLPGSGLVLGGSGASRTLSITPAAGQTGTATVTLTVSDGALNATTNFAVTVTAPAQARLVNLSTRGLVRDGDPQIAGFSIGGSGTQTVLIRAVGKSLESFGITDAIGSPVISVVPSASGTTLVQTDTGWDESGDFDALVDAMVQTGAFPLESGSRDAALLVQLPPGLYTAVVEDSARKGGTCLVEVYMVDTDPAEAAAHRLLNLSTRGYVGRGQDVMIAGLVVQGTAPQRVLVRGVGAGLRAFGVSEVVGNPEINVYAAGASSPFASNDNWDADPASATAIAAAAESVGAFALVPGSGDAALLLDLEPGIYTVHCDPATGASGTGLIEVYTINP